MVNLHIDLEAQKSYRPGYPIERCGIYYAARSLTSQLNVLTERTDYNQLEKCYSIWICRDDVPKDEKLSVSFYKMVNYYNEGKCAPKQEDYDLLHLVIVRLGDESYESEGKDLFDFLTALMYPRKQGFRKNISKYIDVDEIRRICRKIEESAPNYDVDEIIKKVKKEKAELEA